MSRPDYQGILDNPDNERIIKFAQEAGDSNQDTSRATGALILAEFNLAKTLEKALNTHANALIESTNASEKYTKGLNRATWALAVATVVMAVATIVIAYVGYLQVNSPIN